MKKLILLLAMLPTILFAAEGDVDTGATAWMLIATALVLLMVPGLGMFYGGLVRTKNVVGTMMHSFGSMAVVGVIWVVIGYSMAFGPNVLGGWFGWSSDYFILNGIDTAVTGGVPDYVFAMFQGMFAILAVALISGAFAERIKFKGYLIFIALWSIIVYNPLCHWVWAADGFLCGKAIDLAGGTVIHISAGVAGLVCALFFGARYGYPKTAMKPNSLVMTLMGAGLLWIGWFGFNAGSPVSAGIDAGRSLAGTQIAAATGALVWMIIEGIFHKKATSLGFVSGMLAGLVAITPAAKDVGPSGAIALGAIAAIISYCAVLLKDKLGYDDSLDVFGIHGVSGIVGAIGLSFFLLDGHGHPDFLTQLWYQTEGALIGIVYSGVVTFVILVVVNKVFGLKATVEEEKAGLDFSQHGEHGYGLNNIN